jgi:hypothetical protein
LLSGGGLQGGHKMVVRHVETLRSFGFNAVCLSPPDLKIPQWFHHKAPIVIDNKNEAGDIIVIPEDAAAIIRQTTNTTANVVLFCQNLYNFSFRGFPEVDRFPEDRFPPIIGVGPRLNAGIKRAYPQARLELVPCFADERIFKPGAAKGKVVSYVPRKRPTEAAAIIGLFRKFHPQHAGIPWEAVENLTEIQTAERFAGASLSLSLNRLESVGMTTLEAMASGCLCAGFTGVGGDHYATPENGFWVPNEDCEAAADAMAMAIDVLETGGPALQARLEAGYETARKWSYANFKLALEDTWMRLAPEARLKSSSLDD